LLFLFCLPVLLLSLLKFGTDPGEFYAPYVSTYCPVLVPVVIVARGVIQLGDIHHVCK